MTSARSAASATEPTSAAWSFLIGDLRTGRIAQELPILDPSWTAPLNDAGTFAGTLNLADPAVAALRPYINADVARTFLAVELGGVMLYGGPIWAHRYSSSTRRLRLAGAGLWSVFDHRKVVPALAVDEPTSTEADTGYNGVSYRGIARRLLVQAFEHTGGELPIVHPDGSPLTVPYPDASSPITREYHGYELTWLGDALRELTDLDDGPDLDLVPRRRADAPNFVEWVLRAGTPYLEQAGAPWTLETTAVADIDVDKDGTGLAGRMWSAGGGTQRLRVIRHTDTPALVASGAPLLEAQVDPRDAGDAGAVQAHANAAAALRSRPVEAWTVKVRTASAQPGTYLVGDRFLVPVDGDPYLPDGNHAARCLAIGGDASHLTLTMEPTPAGVT